MDDKNREIPDCQRNAYSSRVLELELEARDQERVAIARLVDQAHSLILQAMLGAQNHDALQAASEHLDKASKLLHWPLPFAPATASAPQMSEDKRAALLKLIDEELNRT